MSPWGFILSLLGQKLLWFVTLTTQVDDLSYIRKTFQLAKKGAGFTSPNPLVGAVVVKDGQIVATGYHRRFGGPHAEIFALDKAGRDAKGATLYVNLEPCAHYGKTPPCVDRIISSGVRRVVISTIDPNPLVNGKGIEKLRQAGIQVTVGVGEEEGLRLNEVYCKYISTGFPFVVLKIAQSLDGKIATCNGNSKWITSEQSRRMVHRLRAQYDAVLVGANTVICDNPQLNVRLVSGRAPKRIILDSQLNIPTDAVVLNDEWAEQTYVFCCVDNPDKAAAISQKGGKVVRLPAKADGLLEISDVLKWLGKIGIASVMVEGGHQVFTEFLRSGLVDKIFLFVAPIFIGKGLEVFGDLSVEKIDQSLRINRYRIRRVREDFLVEGYVSGKIC